MDDDLNLPEAMGAVFTLVRALNRELDGGSLGRPTRTALLALIDEVDDVLGVLPLVERERAGADLSERGAGAARARARRPARRATGLRPTASGMSSPERGGRRGHSRRTALAPLLTHSSGHVAARLATDDDVSQQAADTDMDMRGAQA